MTLGAPTGKTHSIGGEADGVIEASATVPRSNGVISNGNATVTGASPISAVMGVASKKRTPLFRRHSTFQSRPG